MIGISVPPVGAIRREPEKPEKLCPVCGTALRFLVTPKPNDWQPGFLQMVVPVEARSVEPDEHEYDPRRHVRHWHV